MATSEPATEMTPLEYLKQADKEMAAGNGQKAAGLLWKAAEGTFIKLALVHELDYNAGFIPLAKALESKEAIPNRFYRANLIAGELLQDHAEMDALEGCELESAYDITRKFVLACHNDLE